MTTKSGDPCRHGGGAAPLQTNLREIERRGAEAYSKGDPVVAVQWWELGARIARERGDAAAFIRFCVRSVSLALRRVDLEPAERWLALAVPGPGIGFSGRVHAIASSSRSVLEHSARLWAARGQYDTAVGALECALKCPAEDLASTNGELRLFRAQVLLDAGRLKDAEAALRSAPRSAAVALLQAELALARADFGSAIALSQGVADAESVIARAFLLTGRTADARAVANALDADHEDRPWLLRGCDAAERYVASGYGRLLGPPELASAGIGAASPCAGPAICAVGPSGRLVERAAGECLLRHHALLKALETGGLARARHEVEQLLQLSEVSDSPVLRARVTRAMAEGDAANPMSFAQLEEARGTFASAGLHLEHLETLEAMCRTARTAARARGIDDVKLGPLGDELLDVAARLERAAESGGYDGMWVGRGTTVDELVAAAHDGARSPAAGLAGVLDWRSRAFGRSGKGAPDASGVRALAKHLHGVASAARVRQRIGDRSNPRRATWALISLPDRLLRYAVHCGEVFALPDVPVGRDSQRRYVEEVLVEIQVRRDAAAHTLSSLRRLGDLIGISELYDVTPPLVTQLEVYAEDAFQLAPLCALPGGCTLLGDRFAVAFLGIAAATPGPFARLWANRPRLHGFLSVGVGDAGGRGAPLRWAAEEAEILTRDARGAGVARAQVAGDTGGALPATAERVLRLLERSHTVHISCHGTFDAHAPLDAGLELSDRRLYYTELASADLRRLQTVVLSCCWAGGAQLLSTGEIYSPANVLLGRGVRQVVTNLWEINDEERAVKLFRGLHRALRSHGNAAAALRETVRSTTLPAFLWAGLAVHL